MNRTQELLDKEASLGNRRLLVHKQIKIARGDEPRPCWGLDDCSTLMLIHCPWRIDCDSHEAEKWQESTFS